MTQHNLGPLAAVVAGMTAAASAGTYVGARLAGKTHQQAKKNLLKNTFHTALDVTHTVHFAENVYELAESTSPDFNS
ncbi:hypothetical protein [Planktothrix pseudagardhii]|uniref:Uncharacterized protein n=1 Tax=Planktothrix pseudagardhii TaxID=132604 RepID=A0A9W4G490_9CYAN|nr:hypothetical protein [Planktothrix pseudagardhii]CAD5931996.1 hypothetical protein NO713_01350 [Planktothrix pseudagardhii]